MRSKLITALLFLFFLEANSQTTSKNDPKTVQLQLEPGDSLPFIQSAKLVNHSVPKLRLTDYKGQLVVLDFWATWCLSCIKAIPKVEQLADKFKGKVKIIQVTNEDEQTVKKFSERRKKALGKAMTLTGIYGDTSIQKLFDYSYLPTIIWINRYGIVQAITDGDSLNASNIEKALQDPNYDFCYKRPADAQQKEKKRYVVTRPFFGLDTPGDSAHLLRFSSFSKNIEEIFPQTGFWIDSSGTGYSFIINMPLKGLYQQAYNLNFLGLSYGQDPRWTYDYYNNRTIMEIKDTTRFPSWESIRNKPDSVRKKFLYTYQAIVPHSTYKSLYENFQTDLKNFFGLHASIQKRKLLCMVLTAKDTNLIRSKGGHSKLDVDGAFSAIAKNVPLSWFTSLYNQRIYYNAPMINETGFEGNVDIELVADLKDIKSLEKALQKYAMDVKLEERTISCLVVSD